MIEQTRENAVETTTGKKSSFPSCKEKKIIKKKKKTMDKLEDCVCIFYGI